MPSDTALLAGLLLTQEPGLDQALAMLWMFLVALVLMLSVASNRVVVLWLPMNMDCSAVHTPVVLNWEVCSEGEGDEGEGEREGEGEVMGELVRCEVGREADMDRDMGDSGAMPP